MMYLTGILEFTTKFEKFEKQIEHTPALPLSLLSDQVQEAEPEERGSTAADSSGDCW